MSSLLRRRRGQRLKLKQRLPHRPRQRRPGGPLAPAMGVLIVPEGGQTTGGGDPIDMAAGDDVARCVLSVLIR